MKIMMSNNYLMKKIKLKNPKNKVKLNFYALHNKIYHFPIKIEITQFTHIADYPKISYLTINHLPSVKSLSLGKSLVSITSSQAVFVYPRLQLHNKHKFTYILLNKKIRT